MKKIILKLVLILVIIVVAIELIFVGYRCYFFLRKKGFENKWNSISPEEGEYLKFEVNFMDDSKLTDLQIIMGYQPVNQVSYKVFSNGKVCCITYRKPCFDDDYAKKITQYEDYTEYMITSDELEKMEQLANDMNDDNTVTNPNFKMEYYGKNGELIKRQNSHYHFNVSEDYKYKELNNLIKDFLQELKCNMI